MDAHHRPSETAGNFISAVGMAETELPLAAAAFECNLQSSHDADTHVILIGRVTAAPKGEAEPLVCCNRSIWRNTNH